MEYIYRPQRSCEGYVFTGVCLSTGGGGVSQHALQVVSQHALQQVSGGGGIQACLAASLQGGLLLPGVASCGEVCLLRGVPAPKCVCVCVCVCGGDPLPASRWLLLRTVRILLECILAFFLHWRPKCFAVKLNEDVFWRCQQPNLWWFL